MTLALGLREDPAHNEQGMLRDAATVPCVGRVCWAVSIKDRPCRIVPWMHVHVSHPDGEAKFWLQPEPALAESVGLSARQLADAQDIVNRHTGEVRDAWIRHFGA